MERNREQIETFINARVTGVTTPTSSGYNEFTSAAVTSTSSQFSSIMWQHNGILLAPASFSLLGHNVSTVYRVFKLYYLGDSSRHISPLRYMTCAQAAQVPASSLARGSLEYKKQVKALNKNYKRCINCALALSTHCQLTHPTEWAAFCAEPRTVALNAVFNIGFKSLQKVLVEALAPLASGKKRKKTNWNKIGASAFWNKSEGYVKRMRTMDISAGKKAVVKPEKKGQSLIWNVTMPKKALAQRSVNVIAPPVQQAAAVLPPSISTSTSFGATSSSSSSSSSVNSYAPPSVTSTSKTFFPSGITKVNL